MIDKLFVGAFFLFLSTFSVLSLFRIGQKETDAISNKEINISFNGDYSFSNSKRLVREHFDNRIAYKSAIYKALSNFELNLFDRSIKPNKVVKGNNGWYYLGNDFRNVLETSAGLSIYPKRKRKVLINKLIKLKKKFNNEGIDFVIAVAPNKHSVYPEHLPYTSNGLTKLDILDKNNIPGFINFKTPLLEYKNQNRLYHKTNSHWNSLGSFYAYQHLIDRLNKESDMNLVPLNITQLRFDTVLSYSEDLTAMIQIEELEQRIESKIIKSSETYNTIDIGSNINYPNHKKHQFERIFKNLKCSDNCLSKTIFYRDSFGTDMINLLLYNTKQLNVVHSYTMDFDYIKKQKPDLVIYEIVERNIDFLFKL